MSGKKAQTVGYYYFLGIHWFLCHGPVDYVDQVWFDKKLAAEFPGGWTGGQKVFFNLNLFGGDDKEGGVAGPFDLDMGGPTQTPNAYLVSKLVGQLVPAFRGIVGIIAKQIYVGTTTYLKNPGFRTKRIHVRTSEGIAQWYDAKAEIAAVIGGGELISAVGVLFSAPSTKSADGLTWTNGGGSNPASGRPVPAEDRYLVFGGNTVHETLDGLNWSLTPASFPSIGGGSGRVVKFKDAIWFPGGLTGVNYSIDKGQNVVNLAYPTYPRTTTLAASPNRIASIAFYNAEIQYCDTLGGAWSVGYTHNLVVGFGMDGDWGNDEFMFSAAYDTGGAVYRPRIVRSPDCVTGFVETLPSAFTSGTAPIYCAHIRYGNGRWVAINNLGIIIYKLDSGGGWQVSPFALTGASSIAAFDFLPGLNKFITYANAVSGLFVSTDGITWTATTYASRAAYYASGVNFDTRTSGRGDMNPAHIIRECLTDPDWGLGYPDSDIDDVAFAYAADVLYDEGMGISLELRQQTKLEDFINIIIRHIDASLYVDRATGKYVLKLTRADYVVGSLPVLNESNIAKLDNFTRPTIGELCNSVTVNFWNGDLNKDDSITAQDGALNQIQGVEINTTVDYSGFTKRDLAGRVALRDLRSLSTPIASCTIYANRDAADLNIGDPFVLQWSDFGIASMVMRVTGAAYGDGKSNQVRLTCTQDVYALPVVGTVTPDVPGWVDPSGPAVPATNRLPYEVPYLEAVQQIGQTEVDALLTTTPEAAYVGIAAAKPNASAINAELYTNAGAGYIDQGTMDFSPFAQLNGAISKTATVFAIDSGIDLEAVADGSWLQVGTEIMVKVSYVAPNLTVKRGALDTVPVDHADNAKVYFWDAFNAADDTEYADGETINIKVATITPSDVLALADAPADSITVVGRMARPYPPGQFKVNGAYYPSTAIALLISWVHRDRLTQTGGTYLGTLDAGVGPEAGTTYRLRFYNHATNTLLHTQSGISGTSYDATGDIALSYAQLRIELEAVCSGLASYQFHSHIVNYTSGADRRIRVGGDVRRTVSGDIRYSL